MKPTKPPKLIVVTSRKGGVGKSTISCHLSVCAGPDAVLIDTDVQADEGSSSTWMKARSAQAPRFYSFADYRQHGIDRLLTQAEIDGASHVIVDTAPRADAEIAGLVSRASINIVVTEPSFLALSALPRSLAIAQAAGKPIVIAINKVKSQRLESTQAREALAEIGIPVFEFSDLADFARALANGQAVHEFSPKGKAAEQIRALWAQIEKDIK